MMISIAHFTLGKLMFAGLLLAPDIALAAGGGEVVVVMESLLFIALCSFVGSALAERLGQASAIGALGAGVLASAIYAMLETSPVHWLPILAGIGMALLLLEAGVETQPKEMLRAGSRGLAIAGIGMVLPFLGGYLLVAWMIPETRDVDRLIVATAMTATSVGISLQTFKKLGLMAHPAVPQVLAAAIADDIGGMLALAVVKGLAMAGAVSLLGVALVGGKALAAFLIIAVTSILLVRVMPSIKSHPGWTISGGIFAYILAEKMGLAGIVGAFAYGLGFAFREGAHCRLREMFDGAGGVLLYNMAFAAIGLGVVWDGFQLAYLPFVIALTSVGVITKLLAGLAATPGSRFLVGAAMVSRGEVGLAVAALGHSMGLHGPLFVALVLSLVLMTLVSPWLMGLGAKFPQPVAVLGGAEAGPPVNEPSVAVEERSDPCMRARVFRDLSIGIAAWTFVALAATLLLYVGFTVWQFSPRNG